MVKLLSGESRAALIGQPWRELRGDGCAGRFVPALDDAAEAAAEAERKRPDAELSFEAWLRKHTCAVSKTEARDLPCLQCAAKGARPTPAFLIWQVNVQLGDLTLNQNHMQLLDAAICRHPDFAAAFGAVAAGERFSCAEVQRCEHRRWLRLLAGARRMMNAPIGSRQPRMIVSERLTVT